MSVRLDTTLDQVQEQRITVSPSLIEANYILSLSQQELQAVIATELLANPALETEERTICPLCGNALEGGYCATCLVNHQAEHSPTNYEDHPEILYQQSPQGLAEDDFDPLSLVATESNLSEQILSDVRTLIADEELPIAAWLVANLDERGYLAIGLDSVAATFDVSTAVIERVLDAVQQVSPVGVAARDVRECLLLQLDFLQRRGLAVPGIVYQVVENYLDDLAAHKHGYIAGRLGVTTDAVEMARDFIRAQLSPYPLQNQEAHPWKTPNTEPYVAPDVIISLIDDELQVQVIESRQFFLKLNGLYGQLAATIGHRNSHNSGMHDSERQHIRDMTSRAKIFIANVQQRRDTLRKIALCLIELQEDFLRGGVRELRPLTRAIVAQQVGVHESTVSRATANKYVMLPNRKVIPFSDFFTPSLSVKDVIREFIVKERNRGEPLTDREICQRLQQQGIRIARRTVAKYRAELGILPSTMR